LNDGGHYGVKGNFQMLLNVIGLLLQASVMPPSPKAVLAQPAASTAFTLDESFVARHDANHDGGLDIGEFQRGVQIDVGKWLAAQTKSPAPVSPKFDDLSGPFEKFDRNGDGRITAAELAGSDGT
jgi:hypothetical protein